MLARHTIGLLVLVVSAVCADAPLWAVTPLPVRCSAWESRILQDAADGRFEKTSLLMAALVASGVENDDELARYSRAFQQICRQLEQQPLEPAGHGRTKFAEQAAEQIHHFLHTRVLTGRYVAECNELQQTLERGDYNCLTATILFQCLAERLQLPTSAWATSTHVFCRTDGDAPICIELTTEHSAAAVYVESNDAKHEPATGDRWANDRHPKSARQLSATALIAKVFYNRAVAALAQQQFAVAVSGLQKSLQLDPVDSVASQNLLAAINNWALAETESKRFNHAAKLLHWGSQLDPDYAAFAVNDLHVHQQWILQLCRENRFAEALDILEQGFQRRPTASLFGDGRAAVWHAWAAAVQRRGDSAAAADIVARGLRAHPHHAPLQNLYRDLTGPRS